MKTQRLHFYLISIVFLAFASFNVRAEEPCYVIVVKSGIHKIEVIRSIGVSLISEHIQKVMPPPESGFSKNDCHYKLNLVETLDGLHISISGKKFNGFGIANRKEPEGVKEAILSAVAKTKKPEPVSDNDLNAVVETKKPNLAKKTSAVSRSLWSRNPSAIQIVQNSTC